MRILAFIICFLAVMSTIETNGQVAENRDLMRYHAGRNYYTQYGDWAYVQRESTFALKKIAKVSEYSYSYRRIRGKQKLKQYENKFYDSSGYLVKKTIGKNSENHSVVILYAVSNGFLDSETVYKNNKLLYKTKFEWDSLHRQTAYYFWKKHRLVTYKTREYSGNKVSKVILYKKGSKSPTRITSYTYENDTGRLLLITSSKANGKIEHRWDYSCNMDGELKKAELKKESRVCISKTVLPDGHRREVYEGQYAEGFRRTVYEYDSLNRVVLVLSYRGKNGEVLWIRDKWEIADSFTVVTQERFNLKNGNPEKMTISVLDGQKNYLSETTSYFKKNGKYRSSWKTEYLYNDDLLVRTISTNLKKPRVRNVSEQKYLSPGID